VFVNSMSDLFHKKIPQAFVAAVFDTMEHARWHQYQILTKRSSLLRAFVNRRYQAHAAPPHIWLGVSVEDRRALRRIDHLRGANAAVRFLSVEPLLERLGKVDLEGIDWVIVGGESGPRFRPMEPAWAREMRDQCLEAGVAFFFKQWGGLRPKSGGNELDGRVWADYPAVRAAHPASRRSEHGREKVSRFEPEVLEAVHQLPARQA
jgi:protein gp37